MSQNVMITGAGKKVGLGFNLALKYLEDGDTVVATVRKEAAELNELRGRFPGWIRTDGREDNPAPLSSYEAACILKDLFENKRHDFDGHRFITNEGCDYPF